MNKRLTRISKYLSFILKHNPESIGMQLDPEGWLNVDELITNANANGKSITLEQLREVVASNDQQRFTLSDDGLRIRASDSQQATL
jgi:putative RNA 2'-phosphotransferase